MKPFSASSLRWGLIALSVSVLPHANRLPLWVNVMLLTSLSWRLLGAYRGWRLPARGIRWVAAVVALALVFFNYRTINGLQAGSALLVAMLALKVLETNRRRDLVALVLSAYFLTITNLLYAQHIPALIYAFIAVWITSTALLQISINTQPMKPKAALLTCGNLLAQSIPIMLILFLLFPRIPTPFVGLSNSGVGRTGLSEEMSPGTITNLVQSDEIAFTVKFGGQPPPYSRLYWRGPVLHDFDGQSWSRHGFVGRGRSDYDVRGVSTAYTVTMEPNQRNWLFALDVASSRPDKAQLLFDFQLVNRQPIAQVYRYDVRSHLDHTLDPNRTRFGSATDLPKNIVNRATFSLAKQLRTQHPDDEAYIGAVLRRFNEQEFIYTLQPPALDMGKPVDDFLFNTRAGFCEHYASAFAMLMRAANIPARVVTGYMGGEFNPITGHLTVRNSEAHAWTEVWLPKTGWHRVDPTAAVAPERVQDGLAGAIAVGDSIPGFFIRNNRLLLRLRYGYDAINILWNDFVLGYGPEAQKALLAKLGLRDYDWGFLVGLLTVGMAIVMAVLWYLLMRQIRPRQRDEVIDVYRRFCDKLGKLKLERLSHEGPVDFANRIVRKKPELKAATDKITATYVRLRYESSNSEDLAKNFKRLVRDFQPG